MKVLALSSGENFIDAGYLDTWEWANRPGAEPNRSHLLGKRLEITIGQNGEVVDVHMRNTYDRPVDFQPMVHADELRAFIADALPGQTNYPASQTRKAAP